MSVFTALNNIKCRSNFSEVDVAPAGLNPNHMHSFKPWNKDVQSCIKVSMKLYKELRLHGTHCLYTFIESEVRKVHKVEKVTKIKARIISKPHAYLQTMENTCEKFKTNRYKIV